MLNIDKQIKLAYEQENMTPEEIASDNALDVVAVKAKLMMISSLYRKACGQEPLESSELNFSDEQAVDFLQVIHEIALDRELEAGVRLKAAMYGRDDKKGRRDVIKAVQGNNLTIFNINEAMANMREGMNKVIQMPSTNKQLSEKSA